MHRDPASRNHRGTVVPAAFAADGVDGECFDRFVDKAGDGRENRRPTREEPFPLGIPGAFEPSTV